MDYSYDDDFVSLAHAEDIEQMKRILGFVSADGVERALRVGLEYGYVDVVEFLITHVSISDPHSQFLTQAVFHGYIECVTWMMSISDAKANNSRALQEALVFGHEAIFELLYPVSDPQAALYCMQKNTAAFDEDDWGPLEKRISLEQHEKLRSSVPIGNEKSRKI